MHQHLRAGLREKQEDSGYIIKMVKTYLCHILNVWNKTELRVKNHTLIFYRLSWFKIL